MKAFMFPGQGSQFKGMGGDLFDQFPELVEKADKVLGYSIKELCLEDPRRELNKTQFTQPALYVVNALSYFDKVEKEGKPDFVAGHSLGEFNALLAAECFDFETGLKLVKKRGELMSQATEGAMAAVLNASEKDIRRLLKENNLNNIDLANFNTQTQIVISGARDEIGKAESVFQQGNMLYSPLNTSGAFHSRYMASAKEKFIDYIKLFKTAEPKITVISNYTATPYESADIVENLGNQIAGSVRWFESMKYLLDLSLEKGEEVIFEEVGSSEILTRMIRKIKTELSYQPPISKAATVEVTSAEEIATKPAGTVEAFVESWNKKNPIGTKVKSTFMDCGVLETRTPAVILFGHRPAVYMKDFKGYFDLNELVIA